MNVKISYVKLVLEVELLTILKNVVKYLYNLVVRSVRSASEFSKSTTVLSANNGRPANFKMEENQ